ncbi:Ecdysone receptor B1 isoform [Gryllus bimaculatus]|nr:Ecdysone receptor B1 isoform [Gryllus bimaculatus]
MTSVWACGAGGVLGLAPRLAAAHQMGDESSPEVTSSGLAAHAGGGGGGSASSSTSSASGGGGGAAGGSGPGSSLVGVISPAHSLGSSDIGEVDLDLFDLDINSQYQGMRLPAGASLVGRQGPCSDTSGSISGTLAASLLFTSLRPRDGKFVLSLCSAGRSSLLSACDGCSAGRIGLVRDGCGWVVG